MTVDIRLSQLNSIQQYIMGLAMVHFLFTKILCINMHVKLKCWQRVGCELKDDLQVNVSGHINH